MTLKPKHCTGPLLLTSHTLTLTHNHMHTPSTHSVQHRDNCVQCVAGCVLLCPYQGHWVISQILHKTTCAISLSSVYLQTHTQSPVLVVNWSQLSYCISTSFCHFTVSEFPGMPVSAGVCLCVIMSVCVFPEMWCCPGRRAIQSTGDQWEGGGQPSCPVLLVVIWYDMLKRC